MNVQQTKVDDLNLKVSLTIEKEDYAAAKKKNLNDFRRQADIKGFRKGMAPMGLIEKLHGGQALAQAINSIVTEQLNKVIEDNKLNILGEPLPSENGPENDWDTAEVFNFDFDIALAPKVEVAISTEDKIPYYNVPITDVALEDYKSSLFKQYGSLEKAETAKDEDLMVVDLVQGETQVLDAYISLRTVADQEIKDALIGKGEGFSMEIDVTKAFANETDRASLLRVKKEELADMAPVWTLTIKEVKTFVDAKPTQELFDQMYGEGVVKGEEEFTAKIKEQLAAEYVQECDYRFMIDAKEYLLNKTNIQLPDPFMKRWLFEANEGKFTMEDIEREYDLFAKDFRWQMIRTYIMKEQNLKVTKEDLLNQAKHLAAYQFAMYGMKNVPDETLTSFAEKTLSDEQQGRRIFEKVEDDIALSFVRKSVTLENKEISVEEMRKLTE